MYAAVSTHPFPIELTTTGSPTRFLAGCRPDANGTLAPSWCLLSDAELSALQALSASDPRAQGLAQCKLVAIETIDGVPTPTGRAALDAAVRAATVNHQEIEHARMRRRQAQGV